MAGMSAFANVSPYPWHPGNILKMIANPAASTHGQLTKEIYSTGKESSEQAAKDAAIMGSERTKKSAIAANDAVNALRLAAKGRDLQNEDIRHQISIEGMKAPEYSSTSRNLGMLGSGMSAINYINTALNERTKTKKMDEALSGFGDVIAMYRKLGLSD